MPSVPALSPYRTILAVAQTSPLERRRLLCLIIVMVAILVGLLLSEGFAATEKPFCDRVATEKTLCDPDKYRDPKVSPPEDCNGPYKDRNVPLKVLEEVLVAHRTWLNSKGDDGQKANLCGAKLKKAALREADLKEADLRGADLWRADLAHAKLRKANLSGARLSRANLRHANLSRAVLKAANLRGADLEQARLWAADLSEASLLRTKLRQVIFTNADLTNAWYEPSSSPDKGFLGGMKGLKHVCFCEGQQSGLVLLRTALKDAGLRTLEREATYAIEHWKTTYASWPERSFKRLFFEKTCGYGLYYGFPLVMLVIGIPTFSVLYSYALCRGNKRAGIWVTLTADHIHRRLGVKTERRRRLRHISLGNPGHTSIGTGGWALRELTAVFRLLLLLNRLRLLRLDRGLHAPLTAQILSWLRTLRLALYFSLLSAFHLGWRDLNVGTWISRIQGRDYTLSATGWVRTVSGLQSLISIYLLALWALTYFGRPFE